MSINREYARLRRLGWRAAEALWAARVNTAFDALDGKSVRLSVEADECAPDEDYGPYGLIAEVLNPLSGEWEHVDSVWGFAADDLQDNGYDTDLKKAALEAAECWLDALGG